MRSKIGRAPKRDASASLLVLLNETKNVIGVSRSTAHRLEEDPSWVVAAADLNLVRYYDYRVAQDVPGVLLPASWAGGSECIVPALRFLAYDRAQACP